MSKTAHLHLFAGYGIEMEYMIVDRKTLAAKPISDQLLAAEAGSITDEVARGDMAWSNELVMHVIELKTNGPTSDLGTLDGKFLAEVERINSLLETQGAMLMPTAMHPYFDPDKDMKLWPHDNAEIYAAYNRIFDCRGHGWSNLQSVHINLPFFDDDEFGRLHAAIRLVLPILPALAASSPIYEGKASGLMDSRLEFYRHNQRAIPSITNGVIPEPAFTHADYEKAVFQKIYRDIAPHDPDGILQDEWLNSRGAIARFQRHAVEIRVLDIQESPRADLAVISAVVSAVRGLAEGLFLAPKAQKEWREEPLREIFVKCLREGDQAVIEDAAYLDVFGLKQRKATANELWRHIGERLGREKAYPFAARARDFGHILDKGCLARRILKAIGPKPTRERTLEVYRTLCGTLAEGGLFHGD